MALSGWSFRTREFEGVEPELRRPLTRPWWDGPLIEQSADKVDSGGMTASTIWYPYHGQEKGNTVSRVGPPGFSIAEVRGIIQAVLDRITMNTNDCQYLFNDEIRKGGRPEWSRG